ncbi:MAG: class I SAM-dependent methyltransferase [Elusimicrobia bacterium]|nr:class I SAM-dependent methyltransferase [Elusimicrobiota bacterium]
MAEAEACPLCSGARDKKPLKEWRSYRWWDCAECGIAFVTPFKNPGAAFYAQYADLYPHEAQEAPDAMSFEYGECLSSFAGREVSALRLLDVGCGAGGFLNQARKRGFQVWGLDFDEGRLKLVREKLGIPSVHQGSLPDFAAGHPEERFDALTMFQVIEHLDRPADWLAAALRLLSPGGRLFIGTPNRDRTFDPFQGPGMEEVDNPPNHLTRWRAQSLKRFVESSGFAVVELKALGVPLPLYALMLRNTLRFGLAARALKVDQIQHAAPASASTPGMRAVLVQAAVKLKELLINSLAFLSYPLFRLACPLFGWQGAVLYCVAEPKAQTAGH